MHIQVLLHLLKVLQSRQARPVCMPISIDYAHTTAIVHKPFKYKIFNCDKIKIEKYRKFSDESIVTLYECVTALSIKYRIVCGTFNLEKLANTFF